MPETLADLKYCEDLFSYRRRKTREVMVGCVGVGGENPIRVQSMTTTDTLKVPDTILQSIKMIEAGCEIVRITAPTIEDARALGKIRKGLDDKGFSNIPLVADIHFSPNAALEAAEFVEKVRINPGNFVDTKRFAVVEYTDAEYQAELERIETRFTPLVEKLKRLKRAVRIGTNHGSLSDRIMNRYGDSPLGMVESSLEFVRICEKQSFHDIIISMKSSNPKVMIEAYRLLAARMAELGMEYPFHLGVTEAGGGEDGRIKSAIGIGSLLADGIGDTIRVSLTEDPEYEVPVCYQLAAPFQKRAKQKPKTGNSGFSHCPDPFSYARRKTRAFRAGPFMLGGSQLVRVATPVSSSMTAEKILAVLEEQLAKAKGADPEIIEWVISDAEDLERLRSVRKALSGETSRLAFLGRFVTNSYELVLDGAGCVDLLCWATPGRWGPPLLHKMRDKEVRWLIETSKADEAARLDDLARENGVMSLLSLRGADITGLIHGYRELAAKASNSPIHIRVPGVKDAQQQVLDASVLIGSLLCDGVGDSVQIEADLELPRALELVYNVLQGAGVRVVKTEFVSCPSCGRTLFDLQSTTERIKAKTGHLRGVKIAIMGCIVNGPGEMADADFGYVGGAPGKINLYVGKECVQKGIDGAIADEALVDLIKSNEKWVEPA
ncbi:MAG: (E)-4-hydroxy-3-methylbut-2-enyl-diphosphate synthase [Elusimicrobia bacterium]|nr:(E)-4-hydroxy-3-methylbut-2-enyl-diphosphate synthase [Elusimicrobiota bacterium]